MVFVVRIVLVVRVVLRRLRWNLVESRPVTIEVGFLSESASYNDEVSESNDKV